MSATRQPHFVNQNILKAGRILPASIANHSQICCLTPVRTFEEGRALVKHKWDKVRKAHLSGVMEGFEDVVPEGELPTHYETTGETVAHVLTRGQAEPRAFVEADTRAARYIAAGGGQPGFGTQGKEKPHTVN